MHEKETIFFHFFSGGNKRKLSTAIALVGNPPIVFLVSKNYQPSVIHSENCVNGYSAPLRQKSMGQNCNQDKL